MLDCRKDDVAWCWVDNTRNTPEMLGKSKIHNNFCS